MGKITREGALALLKKYNKNEALIKHAFAVEAVMRHFAVLKGEDPEKWGIVGLLHDIDYEKYPEQHCKKAAEILSEEGYPEEYIHGVVSHGWGICCDVEPESEMEKVLFTVDELTGFINATAIMRPSKSILDLEVRSVKKKWKDRRFAAGVDRDTVLKGCGILGMGLDDVIQETINGMRKAAGSIGLKGEL